MRGIFVTGTDTGVGKTIAAAVIARLLADQGINVGVMKPVTSGCIERDGKRISEDAELLAYGAGTTVDADVAPYILRDPLAPSEAAKKEGIRIDFSVIREAYRRLCERHDIVIVEGAGGLMVPLSGGFLVADLAKHLELPLLVVARPNLGTINHTLLTTFTARQMDIPVTGVVINRFPSPPGPAEEYAPHLISSLSGAPLLGVFPDVAAGDERELVDLTAERLRRDPLTQLLLKELMR